MEDTKVKCAKCFKEMEEGKYKTCDKCREYMRANQLIIKRTKKHIMKGGETIITII